MSLIQLMMLLRRLPIGKLLAYPTDLKDAGSVRLWLVSVMEAFDVFSDMTETDIDDAIVEVMRNVIVDEEQFNSIYSIVLMLVNGLSTRHGDVLCKVYEVEDKYGFNPAIIITIVQLIFFIIKLIRDRNA